jgi:hypothetical protein
VDAEAPIRKPVSVCGGDRCIALPPSDADGDVKTQEPLVSMTPFLHQAQDWIGEAGAGKSVELMWSSLTTLLCRRWHT